MHKTPFMFVANWKMHMSLLAAYQFCNTNKVALTKLSQLPDKEIILCPSFLAITTLVSLSKSIGFSIGAQNCSEHKEGSYTGEVDVKSLFQAGCRYCIVGHSERRHYFNESSELVAKKVQKILINGMKPIICIGETKEQYKKKETYAVLEQQLKPVFKSISALEVNHALSCIIAYEPVWAIGTGIVPEHAYLEQIFDWLTKYMQRDLPEVPAQLLYGGSVDKNNAAQLAQIPGIHGFLIGGASLDFQKFQKIVSLEKADI